MTYASPAETRERIAVEPTDRPVVVTFHDAVIASTKRALRLDEKGHDPVFYVPMADVEQAFLEKTATQTTCPFKGEASYWSISAEGAGAQDAIWAYESPREGVEAIAGHMAFDRRYFRVNVG
jgi:uncharacterized protein (DUF427 family)